MYLWCHAAPFWVQLSSLPLSETMINVKLWLVFRYKDLSLASHSQLIPATGKPKTFPFAGSVGSKCRRIGAGLCPIRAAC